MVSVATPISVDEATAGAAAEYGHALREIKSAIPQANMVHLFFQNAITSRSDWLALLDAAHREGFQVVVAFAELSGDGDGGHQGFRPTKVSGEWQLGSLGEFVACAECVTHPALYAVAELDEPWHSRKRPFYTTDDLKDLYATLKSLAPGGSDFRIMVQFSRELWRFLEDDPKPDLYWDRGICDVVQISGLEFQDGQYQFDLLDQNHTWSRRIIHETTPEIPLWTSVQVFGGKYGPGTGYWFPRERDANHDLLQLLNDLTAAKYETEHPLTGLMLQQWDSVESPMRALQFTLGDAYLADQPEEQAQASRESLATLADWLSR